MRFNLEIEQRRGKISYFLFVLTYIGGMIMLLLSDYSEEIMVPGMIVLFISTWMMIDYRYRNLKEFMMRLKDE